MRLLFSLALQNFCVILNQHNPSRDKAVHFLVTLKRPDQRNLELQRRVRIIKAEALQDDKLACSNRRRPHLLGGLQCFTVRGVGELPVSFAPKLNQPIQRPLWVAAVSSCFAVLRVEAPAFSVHHSDTHPHRPGPAVLASTVSLSTGVRACKETESAALSRGSDK